MEAKRTKKPKRAMQAVEIGSYRIKTAPNGPLCDDPNKDVRDRLIDHIKQFLSQEK